jgi:muconate cycloisomerase
MKESGQLAAVRSRLEGLTIRRVEVFPIPLPSVRTFTLAGGRVTTAGQPAIRVLVKVTGSDGTFGWGEATPIPSWTYETVESITTTIEGYLAPVTVDRPVWDLDGLSLAFDQTINRGFSIGAPLAKAAVDVAVNDLVGRALDVSLGVLWGQRRLDSIELAWVVVADDPVAVAESVKEGQDLGYRSFKVKIGLHDQRHDISAVAAVRRAAGPDAFLWVDANQAYKVVPAIKLARRLADLDVQVFEQPLPANDIVGLRRLREASPIPIALDESIRHPSDLATFLRLDAVDVVIAKVQRSGGLTLSRRLCQLAEDAGLQLMGSGLTESDVGLAASLHLFAVYGIDAPADLNGRQFIESPYCDPRSVQVEGGRAILPTGPGLGVDVDEAVVRRLAGRPA